MRVVIAHRSGEPRVVDLAEPRGGENYVTVRISHSAMVLPDELYQIADASKRVKRGEDGIPLGSTASGTILQIGQEVRTLKAGLRVALSGVPYVYHGEQLVVPEYLAVELPKKVNHEEGSFAGLGAKALNLVRTGNTEVGSTVLVMGSDMLGLLAAQLVRAAGATPILVDDSEYRLNKARALGIMNIFEPEDDQLIKVVDSVTQGQGVDAALLTRVGDHLAYSVAAHLVREGGVIVLGAPLMDTVSVDLLRSKGMEIRSANDGGHGAGDRAFELLGQGYPRRLVRWTVRDNMGCFCNLLAERRVQISPLITDRVPAERAATIYEKASRSRDSALGVVLTM